MKKVLVLAALLGATALAVPASAASLCVHASVNVNGTAQTLDKCAP